MVRRFSVGGASRNTVHRELDRPIVPKKGHSKSAWIEGSRSSSFAVVSLSHRVAASIASAAIVHGPSIEDSPYYDGLKADIPISTEAGLEVLQRWHDQAASGLMSAVAMNKQVVLRLMKAQAQQDDHRREGGARELLFRSEVSSGARAVSCGRLRCCRDAEGDQDKGQIWCIVEDDAKTRKEDKLKQRR